MFGDINGDSRILTKCLLLSYDWMEQTTSRAVETFVFQGPRSMFKWNSNCFVTVTVGSSTVTNTLSREVYR